MSLPGFRSPAYRSFGHAAANLRRCGGRAQALLATVSLACALGLAGCGRDTPESLLASGKSFVAKHDPKAAIIQLKAALQANGNLAEARLVLGQALLDSGDAKAAVVELNKALELKQPAEQVLPPLARAMVVTGELRKLISQYESVSLNDPRAMADVQTSLALAWSGLGNKAKSEAARAAALKAVPDYGPALILNATAQAAEGDFDGALAKVEAVLTRDPGLAAGWQLKGELLAGAKNDNAGAATAFRRALTADPAYLPAYGSLFNQLLAANDVPAAKTLIDAMRSALPSTHGQPMFSEALLALHENDLKKARELTDRLLGNYPEHLGVLQLAGVLEFKAGSMLAAEKHFVKVLQNDANQFQARRNLGVIYMLLGAPAKALDVVKPLTADNSRDAVALAVAGDAYQQLGDARRAEALYSRAAIVNPGDEAVQTAAMLSRLGRPESDAAISELTVLSQRSKGVYADMAIISARIKRREFDAALKAIDTMATKQADGVAAADMRGRVYLLRNDLPAARKAYEQALKLNPNLYAATASLAAIDLRENKPRDAQKRYEAALAADPRNYLAALSLAELRQAEAAPFDEVRKILQETIKRSPSEAAPRLAMIDLFMRRRQYTEAVTAAQEAAAALPNNLLVMDALGVAQTQTGDLQQAMSTFAQTANLNPTAVQPHLRMAELFRARRDMKGAEAEVRRALDSEPGLEAAHALLIDIALTNKRPNDVVATARELQQRYPNKVYGPMLEGLLDLRVKDNDAAVTAFRAALAAEPAHTGAAVRLYTALMSAGKRADAQAFAAERLKNYPDDDAFEYHLAEDAMGRGDFADGEKRLRSMVERFPRKMLILNNLATAMVALGKPGAVAFAERALIESPDNPPVMDTLASALAAENQLPRALEMQKKAVAAAPEDGNLRLNLAKIALRAKDRTLAKAELDKLAARGRQFPQQDEVAKLLKSL